MAPALDASTPAGASCTPSAACSTTAPVPAWRCLASSEGVASIRNTPTAMQRAHWSIDQFRLGQLVYEGRNSSLFLAKDKQSGLDVAIKQYHKSKLSLLNMCQVQREIAIHLNLKHRNVIKMYCCFEDACTVYLVLRAAACDVFHRLRCSRVLDEASCRDQVIRPCLSACSYLHAKGIVHRDIKPENLLFSHSMELKLADFGLAINTKQERPVTRLGTLDFMAPEVLRCPDKKSPNEYKERTDLEYGSSVDVWAIGVMTFELLTGAAPFARKVRRETYDAILKGDFVVPAHLSTLAQSFLRAALCNDARHRPSVEQLLLHPWITGASLAPQAFVRPHPHPHIVSTKCTPQASPVVAAEIAAAQKCGPSDAVAEVPAASSDGTTGLASSGATAAQSKQQTPSAANAGDARDAIDAASVASALPLATNTSGSAPCAPAVGDDGSCVDADMGMQGASSTGAHVTQMHSLQALLSVANAGSAGASGRKSRLGVREEPRVVGRMGSAQASQSTQVHAATSPDLRDHASSQLSGLGCADAAASAWADSAPGDQANAALAAALAAAFGSAPGSLDTAGSEEASEHSERTSPQDDSDRNSPGPHPWLRGPPCTGSPLILSDSNCISAFSPTAQEPRTSPFVVSRFAVSPTNFSERCTAPSLAHTKLSKPSLAPSLLCPDLHSDWEEVLPTAPSSPTCSRSLSQPRTVPGVPGDRGDLALMDGVSAAAERSRALLLLPEQPTHADAQCPSDEAGAYQDAAKSAERMPERDVMAMPRRFQSTSLGGSPLKATSIRSSPLLSMAYGRPGTTGSNSLPGTSPRSPAPLVSPKPATASARAYSRATKSSSASASPSSARKESSQEASRAAWQLGGAQRGPALSRSHLSLSLHIQGVSASSLSLLPSPPNSACTSPTGGSPQSRAASPPCPSSRLTLSPSFRQEQAPRLTLPDVSPATVPVRPSLSLPSELIVSTPVALVARPAARQEWAEGGRVLQGSLSARSRAGLATTPGTRTCISHPGALGQPAALGGPDGSVDGVESVESVDGLGPDPQAELMKELSAPSLAKPPAQSQGSPPRQVLCSPYLRLSTAGAKGSRTQQPSRLQRERSGSAI